MVDVESQTQLFLKALLSYNFVIRKFARKIAQSYTLEMNMFRNIFAVAMSYTMYKKVYSQCQLK